MDLDKKLFLDFKNTIFFVLFIFLPIFIYLVYGEKSGLFEKKEKEKILNLDFKLIVLGKFNDENNHNTPTFKLNKGNVIGLCDDSLKIVIGDSLLKNKGNSFFFIKRKNIVINKIDLFKNRIYLLE